MAKSLPDKRVVFGGSFLFLARINDVREEVDRFRLWNLEAWSDVRMKADDVVQLVEGILIEKSSGG